VGVSTELLEVPVSRTCPDCNNTYDDEVLHCPEDGRGLSDLPPADELIGRIIGSYKVIKQLGKGGMGAVYMGQHPVIGSKVAIKFLHAQYAHEDKIVDRFFNEARAVNVIGHDNILKILDLNITEDDRHYFIMEYLHGRPLQAVLKHGASVELEMAGPVILQICDALEAAHRKGIIHRDLKPDNVYLISMKGKKNFVKVVDFGIARVTDDAGMSTGKTQTGMVMGTPAYMSPEQGSGQSDKIDARSDIYSLGVMMYQLATGKLPFPGTNFGEVLMGHLQLKPPPPRTVNPEIPEAYEAIIMKCLEKRQEDRYKSMRELRDAVGACMDKLGITRELPPADDSEPEMEPVGSGKPPSTPGMRTPQRRPTLPAQMKKSDPNAARSRPGMRSSNPNLAGGRGPPRPPGPASQPPTHMTQPPVASRTGLFIGLGIGALALVGGGIVVVRMAGKSAEVAMEQQAQRDAARARAAAKKAEDTPPVFLSIVTEPGEADVVATWSGGEEKGQAPFSFEVPKNTKVHFEFSKTGYASYAMDVIADQAQQVRAILHAAAAEKKDARKKKPEGEKKEQLPGEGVIDLDDALK
jgi:serine/threonine protein kinase